MTFPLQELVDNSDVFTFEPETDIVRKFDKIIELSDLGFDTALKDSRKEIKKARKLQNIAQYNYRCVTDDNIEKFLERKVALYNADSSELESSDTFTPELLEQAKEQAVEYNIWNWFSFVNNHQANSQFFVPLHSTVVMSDTKFSKNTKDFGKYEGTGRFTWHEVKVQDYPKLPPQEVLDTFREHKERELFDYFTIGSVKQLPDPILFGKLDEDSSLRWFIAQWGDDVCLDDLI